MTKMTRKASKLEKGITLIALIVTIIILLILAGVTISIVTGNQGIFGKAKIAENAYKNAENEEQEGLAGIDEEISKYMDPFVNTDRTIDDLNTDKGDSNRDGKVDTNDDMRGFYIDLNNDGNLDTANDGVIFGDLLTGGKGVYWCRTTEGMYDDIDSVLNAVKWLSEDRKAQIKEEYNNANEKTKEATGMLYRIKSDVAKACSYKIPTKTNLNTYEFVKDTNGSIKQFEGPFGTRGMLQLKNKVVDGERFYAMALVDFADSNGNTQFTWYENAVTAVGDLNNPIKNQNIMKKVINIESNIFNDNKEEEYKITPVGERRNMGLMTDYVTYTLTEFGKGKENTSKMIARGNNNGKDPYDSSNTSNYGALSDTDVWKVIQTQTNNGWFVPSRDEWNAFGAFFKVGGYNTAYKLSNWCWSSSQFDSITAYDVDFIYGRSNFFGVNRFHSVRLGSTF